VDNTVAASAVAHAGCAVAIASWNNEVNVHAVAAGLNEHILGHV
jgi:hypothetical protein